MPTSRLCRPCGRIARPTRDSSSASRHNPSSSSSGDIGRESDRQRRRASRGGDSPRASTAGCPPMYGVRVYRLVGHADRGLTADFGLHLGCEPASRADCADLARPKALSVRDSATRSAQSPGRHNWRCADIGTTPNTGCSVARNGGKQSVVMGAVDSYTLSRAERRQSTRSQLTRSCRRSALWRLNRALCRRARRIQPRGRLCNGVVTDVHMVTDWAARVIAGDIHEPDPDIRAESLDVLDPLPGW